MSTLKQTIGLPLTSLFRATQELRRRWINLAAHARLSAALGTRIHPSVNILGEAQVHGTARIALGCDLMVYPGLYLETQAEGVIVIGDGCVLSTGVHIVAMASVEIGRGTMIGEYTSIRDANHRRQPGEPMRYAGHDARPIVIGKEVWIGRGATVLGGVTIGDHATVGANAVVTHDVPAGVTVVGVPARPLHRTLQASGQSRGQASGRSSAASDASACPSEHACSSSIAIAPTE
jgi:acetyltransferase-like isoleucine patch superfamily enzyme